MAESKSNLKSARNAPIRFRWFLGIVAFFVLIIAGVLFWNVYHRVLDLQQRLEGMETRAAIAEQEARQTARELALARQTAQQNQERALEAERQAEDLESAKRQSESEAQQWRQHFATADAAARRALDEKEQAFAARRQAREELERVRLKRQEELDRMQRAMNRIAPTQRTVSGMVMQLGNEAFNFDFDSTALKAANRETLSRVAGILLASEGYRLFIDGHTDDVGTREYNQGLSERRAKSVRDYLVKAGIPPEIILIKGFGKSNPLAAATTSVAREKNRRVEIGIVDTLIEYGPEVAGKKR